MTEKQIMKLKGKHIKFRYKTTPYSIRSEEVEGIADFQETKYSMVRNNKLNTYIHYDLYISNLENTKIIKIICWNALKNISNLEIIEG